MSHQIFRIGKDILIYHVGTFGNETIELNGIKVGGGRLVNTRNNYIIKVHKEDYELMELELISMLNESNQIVLDLYKDGKRIERERKLKKGKFKNDYKIKGISKLEEFELAEALELFNKGLELIPNDGEIYFYKSCIYSLEENIADGIASLSMAMENGFTDKERINNEGKLAFLRIQKEFELLMND